MDALANGAQALGPVIHRVHRCHDGQQRLRRANVGRGFVAPDMLLARLQRQTKGVVALRVARHADHTSRHHSEKLLRHREETGVRTTVSEGNAETLRVAKSNVEAEFA